MSDTADQVLNRSQAGTSLIFDNMVIAEIIEKNDDWIEIQDVHAKHWFIHPGRLKNVDYQAFVTQLAKSIANSSPDAEGEGSARFKLGKMKVGDTLLDDSASLATLVEIKPQTEYGPSLTFQDVYGDFQDVYPDLLPNDLGYGEYIDQFKQMIESTPTPLSEPLICHYFREEFIPKMLAQLTYDHECWGDAWLKPPPEGQEAYIRQRLMEYFERYEKLGKNVPWLKIAGQAIIAQALEDHPEWIL